MKHFVVYSLDDGSVRRSGRCADGDLELQAGPGEGVMEATADAIIVAEVNLQPVRDAATRKLDKEAEEQRQVFVTAGSGKAMVYNQKLSEAKAYTADSNAITPILSAEAAATGVTVAALAATVLSTAAVWLAAAAKIEGALMGAKKAITEAGNVGEIHAASQIDWAAVLAS